MRFLASYIMRGPTPAVVATTVSGLLALLFPPLGYVSGAAVALVTLRAGPPNGLLVCGWATLAVALLGWLTLGSPWFGPVLALTLWLPVAGLGAGLRRTAVLGRSLALAGAFGAGAVLFMHLAFGDPIDWWRQALDLVLGGTLGEGGEPVAFDPAVVQAIAEAMTATLGATLTLSTLLCLFIGRWWQALLYNPGGFGGEFQSVRLGRAATVVLALLVALALADDGWTARVAQDMLPAFLVLYVLQGLAVVHALVARSGANAGWLVGLYLLLFLALPQTAVTLAVAGVADNWFGFRQFFGSRAE